MNCRFLHNPYKYKIEQPDILQHNGIKNSETEMFMRKLFY